MLFVLIFTQGTRKYKFAFPCGRLFFSEQRRFYNTFWILYKQYNKPYDKTQRNNGKPEKKIVEREKAKKFSDKIALTKAEKKMLWPTVIRSWIIGNLIGILPGAGASITSARP